MSAAKKNSSSTARSNLLQQIPAWFSGAIGTLILCIVLVGIFIACSYAAWQKISPRVLASPEYFVGPRQFEITPPPPWIHRTDLPTEIYRELSRRGPLSLMDEDLAERVAAAFLQQPWVYKVRHVQKFPGKVKVDLIYRQPVCMVVIPGNVMPTPVDVEGTLLPKNDFTPVEAAKYPRLLGVERGPMNPERFGARWADARVAGGAEIAAALLPLWEKLKLQRIMPVSPPETATGTTLPPGTARRAVDYNFYIITQGGMQILWGHSPAANIPGESTPQQKVEKLNQFFAEHGAMDYPQGPRELDLRRP
jgi:hypothetical protein